MKAYSPVSRSVSSGLFTSSNLTHSLTHSLFAPVGAYGFNKAPPASSVLSKPGEFSPVLPDLRHLVLDCSSPGAHWYPPLPLPRRSPSQSSTRMSCFVQAKYMAQPSPPRFFISPTMLLMPEHLDTSSLVMCCSQRSFRILRRHLPSKPRSRLSILRFVLRVSEACIQEHRPDIGLVDVQFGAGVEN